MRTISEIALKMFNNKRYRRIGSVIFLALQLIWSIGIVLDQLGVVLLPALHGGDVEVRLVTGLLFGLCNIAIFAGIVHRFTRVVLDATALVITFLFTAFYFPDSWYSPSRLTLILFLD